jgi:hypothetical protein
MPIFVRARHATHLQPEDQPYMVHADLGQQALKSSARHQALATWTLIFINDNEASTDPAPGDRAVHQTLLPRGGLHVIEDLLGMRLTPIDDSRAPQMMVLALRRYPADRSQSLLRHRPPPACEAGWAGQ